ncbi:MAG: restriction endonuclease subunit S [Microcystis sp. LE18-22.4A]|jgi:type I restriction enzyme S subunit|uniref:restriction endonuclease subunit S n=1 Tax=Microcystis sp. LE18-22.4A TaxID=3016432 RepID=UPI0022C006BF|nr:restriction endonuclease subunit S [Microcystis sp. LE18-22.4A]MCZ8117561.1 restriction endonuclease subunit S [Microcystis sp. LE18-22.4A]
MSKPTKLPEGWKLVSLGEVGTLINGDRGKNYPSQKDFVDNGVPFINAGHIQNGEIDFESMNFISRKRFDLLGSGKVKSGDILYCLRGSLGKTAIIKDIQEGAIASSLVIIRPSEQIRTDYFYRYLASPIGQAEIYKYDNGSSQPNLSAQSLKQYQLPLPPLEEQRRIAAILDKADGVRRKRKEAIRLTEELLKSTFLEMFGDPVTNPKGWEVESLGDLVEFRTGKLDSNAAVENGRYPFFTCSRVPFSIDEYAFDCEALLLAGNNASADYWVKHYKGKFNAYQRTYILNLKNERISYFYMQKALDLRLNELKQSSRGTNTKYLTLTILKPIKIQLPNIEVQDKYEAFCRSQETQRGRLTQAFEQSENLFNSLLQRAFRGEL